MVLKTNQQTTYVSGEIKERYKSIISKSKLFKKKQNITKCMLNNYTSLHSYLILQNIFPKPYQMPHIPQQAGATKLGVLTALTIGWALLIYN